MADPTPEPKPAETPDPMAILYGEISQPAFAQELTLFGLSPKSASEAARMTHAAQEINRATAAVAAALAAPERDLTKLALDALAPPADAGPDLVKAAAGDLARPGVREAALAWALATAK